MDTDKQLDQIEKIAQNARTTWFGLLALLVFVGVTLMGHKDSDFFAYGAATQLPLVGIEVPPTAFFIAAPILTAAVYIYLHVYLLGLWEALGQIENDQPDTHLSDRMYPMVITIAGMLYRSGQRGDGSMAPRVMGRWTIAIALLLGWGFAPIVLFLLFWLAHVAHNPKTALIGAIALWAALSAGVVSLRAAHLYLSNRANKIRPEGGPLQFSFSALTLIALVLMGLARTQGGDKDFTNRLLARADLAEAHITRRPPDWLDYEDWKKEYTLTFRKRYDLPVKPQDWGDAYSQELQEELPKRRRSLARSLNKISLKNLDLRFGNAAEAFFAGADLRKARLNQTSLEGAIMDGARLNGAQMESTGLRLASMEAAELLGSNMQSADLRAARMGDADLRFASVDATDLRLTSLEGADLQHTSLVGSDLSDANLETAVCRSSSFEGALVKSADLRCQAGSLTQSQLDFTVGDQQTLLPEGLYVWSCLDRKAKRLSSLSARIEMALELHPERTDNRRRTSKEMADALFCNKDDQEPLRREPRKVGNGKVWD